MKRPCPLGGPLPESLQHHAMGTPRQGAARYAAGIVVEGIVVAVYRPGDRPGREDFDENQSVSVSVDVLVTEPRLKTVLRDVPILRQSAGVDNHEAWEPQPATRVISSSATFVFDGAGSGNADPHDTDGDRVLVGFVGNDLNRPVVLGQLDHRHTGHRPDAADGYRWRRWVAGSLIGVTTDGQVVTLGAAWNALGPAPTLGSISPTGGSTGGSGDTITVDNATSGRFRASGSWGVSAWASGRIGANYRYRSPAETSDLAQFKVAIPAAGRYEVFTRVPGNGYSTDAPYVIDHANGRSVVHKNIQSSGATWVSLGTYAFNQGDDWVVSMSCWSNGSGYLIADAVRLARR